MNPHQFKRRQVLKAAGLGVVASAVAKPAIATARLNRRNWTSMICSRNPGNTDSAFAGALMAS